MSNNRTKLSWKEYKDKATKLHAKGLGFPKIYKKLGDPVWDGTEYKVESKGKGRIGRQTRNSRRENKKVYDARRKENLLIRTPVSKAERSENRRQEKQRRELNKVHGKGSHAIDHKYSLNKLAKKVNGLGPRLRNLVIADIEKEHGPVGNRPGNREIVTAQENERRRQNDVKPFRKLRATDRIKATSKFSVIRRGLNGSLLSILPDVIDAIDAQTNGAVNGIVQSGVNGFNNLMINGAKGWSNLLIPSQQNDTNYGQY